MMILRTAESRREFIYYLTIFKYIFTNVVSEAIGTSYSVLLSLRLKDGSDNRQLIVLAKTHLIVSGFVVNVFIIN